MWLSSGARARPFGWALRRPRLARDDLKGRSLAWLKAPVSKTGNAGSNPAALASFWTFTISALAVAVRLRRRARFADLRISGTMGGARPAHRSQHRGNEGTMMFARTALGLVIAVLAAPPIER